ncbi:MAG TPA: Hpt domain-containing protein [Terracidiphilus sp.]
MNPLPPESPAQPPALATALDRLWARFLPEIEERLAIIESAATETAAGNLTREQRQAAQAAAHKLAGILGSFGLAEATAPAREIEQICAADSASSGESSARLSALAAALRSIVASRHSSAAPAQ